MQRRTWLKTLCLAAGATPLATGAENSAHRIQLHVDLTVDPAREAEMLSAFHDSFRPAVARQPGYVDVQMLKLRSTLAGAAPAGANYRFCLTFASEDLRKQWVATETHRKVWPGIEKTLQHRNYNVLLFEVA